MKALLPVLFVLLLVAPSLTETGCSSTGHCTEGQYAKTNVDPNTSACVQQCDCSNMLYEGVCLSKDGQRTCTSLLREDCTSPGRKEACTIQDAFQSHLGCKQGVRVCKDRNLDDLKWGNCTCDGGSTGGTCQIENAYNWTITLAKGADPICKAAFSGPVSFQQLSDRNACLVTKDNCKLSMLCTEDKIELTFDAQTNKATGTYTGKRDTVECKFDVVLEPIKCDVKGGFVVGLVPDPGNTAACPKEDPSDTEILDLDDPGSRCVVEKKGCAVKVSCENKTYNILYDPVTKGGTGSVDVTLEESGGKCKYTLKVTAAQCTKDADCASGKVCRLQGSEASCGSAADECQRDADCTSKGEGYICQVVDSIKKCVKG